MRGVGLTYSDITYYLSVLNGLGPSRWKLKRNVRMIIGLVVAILGISSLS